MEGKKTKKRAVSADPQLYEHKIKTLDLRKMVIPISQHESMIFEIPDFVDEESNLKDEEQDLVMDIPGDGLDDMYKMGGTDSIFRSDENSEGEDYSDSHSMTTSVISSQ